MPQNDAFPIALASYQAFGADYARAIESNAFNAAFERPTTLSLLPPVRGKMVLDAGCGPGAYVENLLAQGARVVGLDVSQAMLDIARERYGDRAEFHLHDLARPLTPCADTTFDIVLCSLAVHYIRDLHALFAEFWRALRPGGCVVFSTHHPLVDFTASVTKNYYDTELLEQTWNTVGRPVQVRFYRRPFGALCDAFTTAGFALDTLSEGLLSHALQNDHPDVYARLSTTPNFIFLRLTKR